MIFQPEGCLQTSKENKCSKFVNRIFVCLYFLTITGLYIIYFQEFPGWNQPIMSKRSIKSQWVNFRKNLQISEETFERFQKNEDKLQQIRKRSVGSSSLPKKIYISQHRSQWNIEQLLA